MRAIAVLGVVAFHTHVPFVRGGFVGVDVFFVLSGFLITRVMTQDRSRLGPGSSLAEFYGRRARRILPAATVVIAATLALSIVIGNGVTAARAVGDAWAATFFFSNAKFAGESGYFFNPDGPSVFQQYWSLSVEEQFYAIWPLLFLGLTFVARRIAPSRATRVVLATLGAICVASFVLNVIWTSDATWLSSKPTYAFYLLWPRAWELGIGALLALSADAVASRVARHRRWLSSVGIAAIGLAFLGYSSHTLFPGWAALLPTLGTTCVITAGLREPSGGFVDAGLSSWPAQMLGRYSYSLYLWHWPVLQLLAPKVGRSWPVTLAVVVGVGLPAAVATYHLVEDPIRRGAFFRRSSARSLGVGVAALAVASVAIVGVQSYNVRRLSTPQRVAATAAVPVRPTPFVPVNLVPRLDRARDTAYSSPGFDGVRGPARDVVALFGDSHADHLVPGLRKAAAGDGLTLRSLIRHTCPWFELATKGDWTTSCRQFRADSLAVLARAKPAVIVVSGRGTRIEAGNIDQWARTVDTAFNDFPSGIPIVVVGETPRAKQDVPRCLGANLRHTSQCNVSWPAEYNRRLSEIARRHGATFVDLRPMLCVADVCPGVNGNRLIWRDRDHLTAEYSATLAPLFRDALRSALGTP